MKSRKFGGIALLLPIFAACSAGVEEDPSLSSHADALVLMEKPGADVVRYSEAGRDIAQKGAYTFYGADLDSNTTTEAHGTAHLFKNDEHLRSYAVATTHPQTFFGTLVDASENWLAAKIEKLPFLPNVLADAVLLVGKDSSGEFESCGPLGPNGEIPNCVSCTVLPDPGDGSPDFVRMACAAVASVNIWRPGAFTASDELLGMSLTGNELVVSTTDKLVQRKWSGSWSETTIPAATSEAFKGAISQSGNRLAAAIAHQDGSRYINIYQRASAYDDWQFAFRVHPPSGNTDSAFGDKLELSGNSMLVIDSNSVHFIDLVKDIPANIDAGARRSCVLDEPAFDVAISGSSAVVARKYDLPMTFERGANWQFHGGLPDGLFPRNLDSFGNSTLASLWGAAIDGDKVAIGWRNHVQSNPANATGAALGFGFDDYDCGTLHTLPDSTQARVKELEPVDVTAPSFYQYPPSNAIDGSSSTRWMAPQTPGTTIAFDLGELRMLNHLEIEWGTTYASNFTVQVTEDGSTWVDIATISGSGGTQVVDLSANDQAFGSGVRLRINNIQVTPGTGDWGVAIKEARIYRRVHESCGPSAPALTCTGQSPSHVCDTACGGIFSAGSCYCDEGCAYYGDCCSFDGANRGAEYAGGVRTVCNYD